MERTGSSLHQKHCIKAPMIRAGFCAKVSRLGDEAASGGFFETQAQPQANLLLRLMLRLMSPQADFRINCFHSLPFNTNRMLSHYLPGAVCCHASLESDKLRRARSHIVSFSACSDTKK